MCMNWSFAVSLLSIGDKTCHWFETKSFANSALRTRLCGSLQSNSSQESDTEDAWRRSDSSWLLTLSRDSQSAFDECVQISHLRFPQNRLMSISWKLCFDFRFRKQMVDIEISVISYSVNSRPVSELDAPNLIVLSDKCQKKLISEIAALRLL